MKPVAQPSGLTGRLSTELPPQIPNNVAGQNEIAADPIPYFDVLFRRWTGDGTLDAFDPQAMADYRAAFSEAARVHAFCEDYRAGATFDRAADEADLAVHRKRCPVLTISGQFYLTKPRPGAPTTVEVWQQTFAPTARGAVVDSGHFVAEENPEAALVALTSFLRMSSRRSFTTSRSDVSSLP